MNLPTTGAAKFEKYVADIGAICTIAVLNEETVSASMLTDKSAILVRISKEGQGAMYVAFFENWRINLSYQDSQNTVVFEQSLKYTDDGWRPEKDAPIAPGCDPVGVKRSLSMYADIMMILNADNLDSEVYGDSDT